MFVRFLLSFPRVKLMFPHFNQHFHWNYSTSFLLCLLLLLVNGAELYSVGSTYSSPVFNTNIHKTWRAGTIAVKSPDWSWAEGYFYNKKKKPPPPNHRLWNGLVGRTFSLWNSFFRDGRAHGIMSTENHTAQKYTFYSSQLCFWHFVCCLCKVYGFIQTPVPCSSSAVTFEVRIVPHRPVWTYFFGEFLFTDSGSL